MDKKERIFIAGHTGMVGSAVMRALQARDHDNIVTSSKRDGDLRDAAFTHNLLKHYQPKYVMLTAARVGGIKANMTYPADFIYDNLMIQSNVIHGAYLAGVKKLMFLGSSCIYPRLCPQPIKEEYLLTGPLEPTNESYAIAKLAGVRMAQAYHTQYGMNIICLFPCNLYGKNDHFDFENSHVLSALVRRFCDAIDSNAPSVTLWGTGSARREFMNVDDLAEAVLFLMDNYDSPEIINVGTGVDISIKELAGLIANLTGYSGEIRWDASMPDGMPRKCLDISRLTNLGYQPGIDLHTGIVQMIAEYKSRKYALTDAEKLIP